MRFASSLQENKDPVHAAEEAARYLRKQMGNDPCDLAFLFVSILYKTD